MLAKWGGAVIFLMLSILGGCAVFQPPRTAIFDESEFAPYAGSGTSTITGQAFQKTQGGDVKYGAGDDVYMVPITSYTREWHDKVLVQGQNLASADPETQSKLSQYERHATADAMGNFEFHNIPAGSYYLTCDIEWQYPSQYGLETTGGIVYGEVTVASGESARIILTP
jgi:hypothetical protein